MHSDLLLYVPGSLPGSTSHISSVNLHNHHVEEKYNYYPHFSGESSEAQRREVTWHSKARTRIHISLCSTHWRPWACGSQRGRLCCGARRYHWPLLWKQTPEFTRRKQTLSSWSSMCEDSSWGWRGREEGALDGNTQPDSWTGLSPSVNEQTGISQTVCFHELSSCQSCPQLINDS